LVVEIDGELVEAAKATASQQRTTLAGFTQAALANHVRNARPVMEYIAEARTRKNRSPVASALDPARDRQDGVPLEFVATWPEKGWREWCKVSTPTQVRDELDRMRLSLDREGVGDAEWAAIQRHLGAGAFRA
jgi:hypothetical protein